MDSFELALVFTAPGAMLAGALVASIVELLKRIAFPDLWQHGRAPLITAALLALAIVALAVLDVGLPSDALGSAILGYVLAWANVTAAAVGGFEVTRKAYRVATSSTNETGEDVGARTGPT
jgi:hypothetical protein